MEKKIKLAELLAARAETQTLIAQVQQRLNDSAKVRVGQTPKEDATVLLLELEQLFTRQAAEIKAVNAANCRLRLADGASLCEAMIDRDILARRIAVVREMIRTISDMEGYVSGDEVPLIPTVPLDVLNKEADDLSMRHRHLKMRIQQADWEMEVDALK